MASIRILVPLRKVQKILFMAGAEIEKNAI
jgi:hypothetical protein